MGSMTRRLWALGVPILAQVMSGVTAARAPKQIVHSEGPRQLTPSEMEATIGGSGGSCDFNAVPCAQVNCGIDQVTGYYYNQTALTVPTCTGGIFGSCANSYQNVKCALREDYVAQPCTQYTWFDSGPDTWTWRCH